MYAITVYCTVFKYWHSRFFFIWTKTNSCIPCGLKWKQKLVVEKKGGDEMCKDRWMEKVKTRLIWEYTRLNMTGSFVCLVPYCINWVAKSPWSGAVSWTRQERSRTHSNVSLSQQLSKSKKTLQVSRNLPFTSNCQSGLNSSPSCFPYLYCVPCPLSLLIPLSPYWEHLFLFGSQALR